MRQQLARALWIQQVSQALVDSDGRDRIRAVGATRTESVIRR